MRFKDDTTRDIYDGKASKKARALLPEKLWGLAHKKIDYALAAKTVDDLRIPPSNHHEVLSGDLAGKWSIRINDRYRVVFDWLGQAENLEIVDYH